MKKLLIIILCVGWFLGCSKNNHTAKLKNKTKTESKYEIKGFHSRFISSTSVIVTTRIIDSCEYILVASASGYSGGICIIHKENCKYCEQRRRKSDE